MVNIKTSGLKEANAQLSGKFPPPRKTHYPSVLDSQDFPLSSFLPRAFNQGHPQPRGFRSPQLSQLFNSRVNREEMDWEDKVLDEASLAGPLLRQMGNEGLQGRAPHWEFSTLLLDFSPLVKPRSGW